MSEKKAVIRHGVRDLEMNADTEIVHRHDDDEGDEEQLMEAETPGRPERCLVDSSESPLTDMHDERMAALEQQYGELDIDEEDNLLRLAEPLEWQESADEREGAESVAHGGQAQAQTNTVSNGINKNNNTNDSANTSEEETVIGSEDETIIASEDDTTTDLELDSHNSTMSDTAMSGTTYHNETSSGDSDSIGAPSDNESDLSYIDSDEEARTERAPSAEWEDYNDFEHEPEHPERGAAETEEPARAPPAILTREQRGTAHLPPLPNPLPQYWTPRPEPRIYDMVANTYGGPRPLFAIGQEVFKLWDQGPHGRMNTLWAHRTNDEDGDFDIRSIRPTVYTVVQRIAGRQNVNGALPLTNQYYLAPPGHGSLPQRSHEGDILPVKYGVGEWVNYKTEQVPGSRAGSRRAKIEGVFVQDRKRIYWLMDYEMTRIGTGEFYDFEERWKLVKGVAEEFLMPVEDPNMHPEIEETDPGLGKGPGEWWLWMYGATGRAGLVHGQYGEQAKRNAGLN